MGNSQSEAPATVTKVRSQWRKGIKNKNSASRNHNQLRAELKSPTETPGNQDNLIVYRPRAVSLKNPKMENLGDVSDDIDMENRGHEAKLRKTLLNYETQKAKTAEVNTEGSSEENYDGGRLPNHVDNVGYNSPGRSVGVRDSAENMPHLKREDPVAMDSARRAHDLNKDQSDDRSAADSVDMTGNQGPLYADKIHPDFRPWLPNNDSVRDRIYFKYLNKDVNPAQSMDF